MVTIALWALSQGRVTLTLDAAPVERLVQRLSAASGAPLRVDADVAREIVAIRFVNADLREAMARVAEGLNARWVDDSGTLTLRRPLVLREAERQAALDRRTKAFAAALAKFETPRYDPAAVFSALDRLQRAVADRNVRGFQGAVIEVAERGPGNRFAKEVVRGLDPAQLASARERMVFCLRPNLRQKPFAAAWKRNYRAYVEAQEALTQDVQNASGRFSPDVQAWAGVPWQPIAGARVRIEPKADRSWWVDFEAWDEGRNSRNRVVESIVPDHSGLSELERREEEPALPLGGMLAAWAQRAEGATWEQRNAPCPEPFRGTAWQPAKTDPLQAIGALIVRCAAARDEDCVAVLGDELLGAGPKAGTKPEAFLRSLAEFGHFAREEPGGLFVEPIDRPETRRRQIDRNVLKTWLDAYRAQGTLTMSWRLRLSARMPLADDSDALVEYLKWIGVEEADWNDVPLRLCAILPPGRHDLRNLSAEAQKTIRRLLDEQPIGDLQRRAGFCGTTGFVLRDATDSLPEGLPQRIAVWTEDAAEPAAFVEAEGDSSLRLLDDLASLEEAERPVFVRPAVARSKTLFVAVGRDRGLRYDSTAPDGIGGRTRLDALPAFRSMKAAAVP